MNSHRTIISAKAPADQSSARVLVIAAGASVLLHAGIGVTVLTAKLASPPASDYWAVAPGWTTEIAFNNDPQLKAAQAAPAPDVRTPTREEAQKLDESTLEPAELVRKQPQQPTEIEVRPGIHESDSNSRDWIGSAIPTPHAAPKSGVNQAGQSMNPGDPGTPGSTTPETEDTMQAATAAPTQQVASQQASSESKSAGSRAQQQQRPQAPQEEQQQAESQTVSKDAKQRTNPPQPKLPVPAELDELGLPKQPESKSETQDAKKNLPKHADPVTEPVERAEESPIKSRDQQDTLPKPSILGAISRPNEAIEVDDNRSNQLTQQLNQQPTPQTSTNNTTTTPSAKSATTGTGGNQKLPGELTDAESAPSSLDNTLEYKPGRPLAGKGIRVRPVAARFAHTTQLTALPKNPRLIVKFNRAGRVVSVEFENKEGTGYPDVDAPLRDSIFRWTASGKALQELPTHDPQATVTMKIEYLLREE